MTLEQHSKTLGTLHLVFGGIQTLFMLLIAGVMLFVFSEARPPDDEFPAAVFWGVMLAVLFFQVLLTVPSFVAGYAILRRKPWAKIAGVAASVVEAMSFPHGTALSVYSLWFLCGQHDKLEQQRAGVTGASWRGALYGAPPPAADWAARNKRGPRAEREYAPPPQPPDWR